MACVENNGCSRGGNGFIIIIILYILLAIILGDSFNRY